jgi:hypothetical protein
MSIEGMMNDVVTIAPLSGLSGSVPTYGTAVSSPARVEPSSRMVRGADGDLHQAHAKLWLPAGTTIEDSSKVTLPDGSTPEVLTIKRVKDSVAEHHVEVVL